MLESTLKTLFDYQRFDRNPALQAVIDEVLDRYSHVEPLFLSDDVLAMAAGGVRMAEDPSQEPEDDGNGTV